MTTLSPGLVGPPECGCTINSAGGELHIDYCALHESAPDMLETLRRLESLCEAITMADPDATYVNTILTIVREAMNRAAKRGP